jgi:hypothetical protein
MSKPTKRFQRLFLRNKKESEKFKSEGFVGIVGFYEQFAATSPKMGVRKRSFLDDCSFIAGRDASRGASPIAGGAASTKVFAAGVEAVTTSH